MPPGASWESPDSLKGPPAPGAHLSSLGPIGTPLLSEEQEEVRRHA